MKEFAAGSPGKNQRKVNASKGPDTDRLFLGLFRKAQFDDNGVVTKWAPALPLYGRVEWLLEDTLSQRTLDKTDIKRPKPTMDSAKLQQERLDWLDRLVHAELTDYGGLRKEPIIQDLLRDVIQNKATIYLKTSRTEGWLNLLNEKAGMDL